MSRETENYENRKDELARYNAILKRTIRNAKKSYYEHIFEKYKNDNKKTWQLINNILKKSDNKNNFPDFFKDNKRIITDKTQIANKFNEYFINIGETIANDIKGNNQKSYKDYLNKHENIKFHFKPIDDKTVIKTITNLSTKDSYGIDGISTNLLKSIKHIIAKPLTTIINQTLKSGIFPEKLKIAKVTPIYKKGDEHLFSNYRPISLLPSMSKIFEKIICIQLYEYFENNNLLNRSQYGFRKKHSTELAALELIDSIIEDMDNGNIPLAIFLDLSKAFDTINHQILLTKLFNYGIYGAPLKLLNDYLSNRRQYVKIGDTLSDPLYVNTGVPQGSILGPLLFIIYINDITNASTFFKTISYADDSTLYTKLENKFNSRSIQTINEELDIVNEWLKLNKLSLNTNKSVFMLFHNNRKKVKLPKLKLNEEEITAVENFNFLGLSINETMTWNHHINRLSSKLNRTIGILNRLKHFLPIKVKLSIYNSLILSQLHFGILCWGYDLDRIVKLQKRALRAISNSKYNAHTEPLFKNLKLLKLADIFNLQQIKFYHKFLNGNLPTYFIEMFTNLNTNTHDYNTRHRANISNQRVKHEYAKRRIKYSIPETINHSPDLIKNKLYTHSLDGLTQYIKHHHINTYRANCDIRNCYICNRNNT